MSALSLSFIGFGALSVAGWRMWRSADTFAEAFRALLAGAVGIIGLCVTAAWCACW